MERNRQDYQHDARHPFQVGEEYANRQGTYEVVEINPPFMTVRYASGELMTAEITILERSWENLQSPPEPPGAAPRPRRSPAMAGCG